MDFEDRVAVVTGAAGGIGAALARRVAERGGRVVLSDLDADRLTRTTALLAVTHGDRVFPVPGDVTSERDVARAIDEAEDRFGPVAVYFANAGVGLGAGLAAADAEWQRAHEVNVLAHVRAARILVPRWLDRGGGYFVSTASAAGLLTQLGSPTYTVSKHGAVAFAEWLAVTYGARGVRVSCLCPMGVDTDLLHDAANAEGEEARIANLAVTSAGAVLSPTQVADEVLAAMAEERFLVLPHPEVAEMLRHKVGDPDRWIAGMQRYADQLGRQVDR